MTSIDNPVNYFPRTRDFWVYHGATLLCFFVFQILVTVAIAPQTIIFQLCVSVLWAISLSFSALSFRYSYRNLGWQRFGAGAMIPLVIAFGLIGAIIVIIITFGCTVPFFWKDIFNHNDLVKQNQTLATALGLMIVSNYIQTAIILCGWIFIYLSITNRRRIAQQELQNLRLQNSLKDAELRSLANQLNPHFLFNTLNNIRFMIHENADHADKMLTSLSDILRYSLTSSQSQKVKLAQELKIIEQYLSIIKLQLEDRLNYVESVDEALLDYLVPPMALQMLLENAIKHGLDHLKHGGQLQLQAKLENNLLLFRISNPVPDATPDTCIGTGTGLENIRQRLKILYGDRAKLITERNNNIFVAELVLPKESEL